MGVFTGRIRAGRYRPALLHRLLVPPISGNAINGLGEAVVRPPSPIYHWFIHRPRYPFRWIELLFVINSSRIRRARKLISRARGWLRRTPPLVAPQKVQRTPQEWAAAVKAAAAAAGASLVGIAAMRPEWVYEGHEVREPWIVILGFPADYEVFRTAPALEAGLETLEAYNRGHKAAMHLSDWIRGQGWHAEGYGAPFASPVNMIPAALAAGLGELGKHGSIINRRYGSAFRLGYVLTGLPLVADQPDHFGVDDFCMRCQVCARACPPAAIFPEKQLVRGTQKWYVDFDKCVPYFNDTLGCGICIARCPWSMPGVADGLVRKLARRRRNTAGPGELPGAVAGNV